MPRNVMISALVTEELAKKLEALAAKEQRLLSSMIAILLAKAVDNPTASANPQRNQLGCARIETAQSAKPSQGD